MNWKLTITIMTALCLASAVYADNGQMSEDQMQQMMEHAEKMQECMGKIDQKAMETHAARAEKVDAEIKGLCAAGKRDEAQKLAMDYGKEMAASREMQDMKKCGEMMQGMVPPHASGENPGHVCDSQ